MPRSAPRSGIRARTAWWTRGGGRALRFGLTAEHCRHGLKPVPAGAGHRAAAETIAGHHHS
ncbi:hypothetical protein Q3V23_34955 [Streptomyces sp. VNUA116]|uniref:hypothetical protein n=1 Tax=Streptomyces sp. VNUA116 TaxID=3062449 RepID=UPI002676E474|nr:hypothetical protein [Streptomyces sp. VNUA116]WKU48845.1 hypothetical protein Q3V23_34955 [Streptomyces sp. VNUA116]